MAKLRLAVRAKKEKVARGRVKEDCVSLLIETGQQLAHMPIKDFQIESTSHVQMRFCTRIIEWRFVQSVQRAISIHFGGGLLSRTLSRGDRGELWRGLENDATFFDSLNSVQNGFAAGKRTLGKTLLPFIQNMTKVGKEIKIFFICIILFSLPLII